MTGWNAIRSNWWLLALLCLLTLALYVSGGAPTAYLAADDFQWLLGGEGFEWRHLVDIGSRSHFYRPVIEFWFAGATRVCVASSPCYHLASLTVHALNVCLVFLLGLALSRRTALALVGATLFALQPGYIQAVVWVSAITGLLATTFYLLSLLFQIRSRELERHRTYDVLAVVAFACAIFSHEAAATLPVVSWLLHRWFSGRRRDFAPRLVGFALVLVAFSCATFLANRNNYVFTEGRYGLGAHSIQHVLDYLVVLYIGPHSWPSYVFCILGVIALLAFDRLTRFGTLWLLITMLPFLGFTWDNSSRYLYLPSIGFALAAAQVIVVARDRMVRRFPARSYEVLFGTIVLVLFVRFWAFSYREVRTQVSWLEASRTYLNEVRANHPQSWTGVLRVPRPSDPFVDPVYVEPMLRWAYRDHHLQVAVDDRP